MTWTPHATVATIVERNNKLLMVEELSQQKIVFNQPAGHIDEGESIFDAARRETLEETGWEVELKALVGIYTYTADQNNVTYYRFCFSASPIKQLTEQLDHDILGAHWMDIETIQSLGKQLRSPMVMKCIEDYFKRPHYPLSLIHEHI